MTANYSVMGLKHTELLEKFDLLFDPLLGFQRQLRKTTHFQLPMKR